MSDALQRIKDRATQRLLWFDKQDKAVREANAECERTLTNIIEICDAGLSAARGGAPAPLSSAMIDGLLSKQRRGEAWTPSECGELLDAYQSLMEAYHAVDGLGGAPAVPSDERERFAAETGGHPDDCPDPGLPPWRYCYQPGFPRPHTVIRGDAQTATYCFETKDDAETALIALRAAFGSLAPAPSGPTNDDRWYIPVGNGCLVTSEGRTSLQLATPEEAVVVRDALNARLAVPGEGEAQ